MRGKGKAECWIKKSRNLYTYISLWTLQEAWNFKSKINKIEVKNVILPIILFIIQYPQQTNRPSENWYWKSSSNQ